MLVGSLGPSAVSLLVHLEHVESHSLGERPALSDHDLIPWADIEGWGAVSRDHLVTLLVTAVLSDVKVITTDGDGVLHEAPVHNATKNLPADADIAGERALLVDVATFLGLGRDLEAQANALHVAGSLAGGPREDAGLALEHVGLLLERPLSLHVHCRYGSPM